MGGGNHMRVPRAGHKHDTMCAYAWPHGVQSNKNLLQENATLRRENESSWGDLREAIVAKEPASDSKLPGSDSE